VGIEIGVVGPHDLVDDVAAICEEQPGVVAHRLDYDHESQAVGLVEARSGSVEAWLFTGVVPYTMVSEAGVLTRPATFVDYTGATLLQAMVRLLRDGHDVSRMSIDTVPSADVSATLREAAVPTAGVRTLPYQSGVESTDVVEFHRRARRGTRGTEVAVTCLSSAYEVLRTEMPAFRLVPSAYSVRVAVRQLLLHADNQAQEDAQIVLGLVELPGGDDGLSKEANALAGSVSRYTGDTYLLVTTRGPVHDVTGGFTSLPMLRRLADRHDVVRVGFGLGRSSAEAETLARRALARARRLGDVAAVLSLRGEADVVLESAVPLAAKPDAVAGEPRLSVLAQRVGISVATLERLIAAQQAAGTDPLTTREVASRLRVQQRTARRMLHRLELAGLAERTGNLLSGASGRPLTAYRITV
jgi:hypothetical protein